MFDDQPIGNNSQIPNNLPIGEPEDMFANVEKGDNSAPVFESASETEPPVRQPASALGAGILKPKSNVVENLPPPMESNFNNQRQDVPPQSMGDVREINTIKEPGVTRGIMIAVVVVVILAILGAIGWWFYNNFVITEDLPVEDNVDLVVPVELDNTEEEVVVEENTNVEDNTTGELTDLGKDIVDEQILFGEPIDKDADGLDDTREADIGTDPNNWDSDSDELSDGDEVIIWKTDPMNPDSDGDSYFDGAEVKSGYNPAGSGKIFEVPTE